MCSGEATPEGEVQVATSELQGADRLWKVYDAGDESGYVLISQWDCPGEGTFDESMEVFLDPAQIVARIADGLGVTLRDLRQHLVSGE